MKWEHIISWEELQDLDQVEREIKCAEIREAIISEGLENSKIVTTRVNEAQLERLNAANVIALSLFGKKPYCEVEIGEISSDYASAGTSVVFEEEEEFGSTNISFLDRKELDLFIELLKNVDGVTFESEVLNGKASTIFAYSVNNIFE